MKSMSLAIKHERIDICLHNQRGKLQGHHVLFTSTVPTFISSVVISILKFMGDCTNIIIHLFHISTITVIIEYDIIGYL